MVVNNTIVVQCDHYMATSALYQLASKHSRFEPPSCIDEQPNNHTMASVFIDNRFPDMHGLLRTHTRMISKAITPKHPVTNRDESSAFRKNRSQEDK